MKVSHWISEEMGKIKMITEKLPLVIVSFSFFFPLSTSISPPPHSHKKFALKKWQFLRQMSDVCTLITWQQARERCDSAGLQPEAYCTSMQRTVTTNGIVSNE
jgi:hypothetical protein